MHIKLETIANPYPNISIERLMMDLRIMVNGYAFPLSTITQDKSFYDVALEAMDNAAIIFPSDENLQDFIFHLKIGKVAQI